MRTLCFSRLALLYSSDEALSFVLRDMNITRKVIPIYGVHRVTSCFNTNRTIIIEQNLLFQRATPISSFPNRLIWEILRDQEMQHFLCAVSRISFVSTEREMKLHGIISTNQCLPDCARNRFLIVDWSLQISAQFSRQFPILVCCWHGRRMIELLCHGAATSRHASHVSYFLQLFAALWNLVSFVCPPSLRDILCGNRYCSKLDDLLHW